MIELFCLVFFAVASHSIRFLVSILIFILVICFTESFTAASICAILIYLAFSLLWVIAKKSEE